MKAKELKELSTAELLEKEAEYKEELFNLRFQLATGQLEDTAQIKKVRKNIARVKTVLRQAELAQ
ncbi:50S ribosomal protein L29 [Alloiococcus otitis]|uniref:Large ribosomal subunit protein uL29 n=1 Tax=Alloiococcus otitis ATCC 51267 TaxID=883081 RepID=K9ERJ6_9LACT|nr:50S ribosomal protein L29 [Alloiococcus otitis]EKU93547.1 50S ribosomal protein L29 [Alloiococcus otitis ATCC 51267]SUU80323.1 50S ribosomal protein L29 [Alloiococcus otitis]